MVKGFIKRNDLIKGSCILCNAKKICDSPSAKFIETLEIGNTYYCRSGDYFKYIPLTIIKRKRF